MKDKKQENLEDVNEENKNKHKINLKEVKWRKVFNKKIGISILGFSIMIFSTIGIVVTMKSLYMGIVRVFNNTTEKEKFERYILPVLMFDPVPFDDPQKADKFSLLRSAIWAAFMNNGKEKYLNENYNSFVVPTSDVDVNLAMLYGNNIKIKHQTFGDGFMNNYIYDKETKTYTVPILDQVGIYSPKVKSISKNGEIYTLTVGYIKPDDIWQMYIGDNNRKTRPEKYMEYVLKKIDGGYNLIAIKDSPIDNNWSENQKIEE